MDNNNQIKNKIKMILEDKLVKVILIYQIINLYKSNNKTIINYIMKRI